MNPFHTWYDIFRRIHDPWEAESVPESVLREHCKGEHYSRVWKHLVDVLLWREKRIIRFYLCGPDEKEMRELIDRAVEMGQAIADVLGWGDRVLIDVNLVRPAAVFVGKRAVEQVRLLERAAREAGFFDPLTEDTPIGYA